MPKSNHKYRATIYLGREIYEQLEEFSKKLECSVSTLTRAMFIDGYEVALPTLKGMFEDVKR